MTDTPQYDDAKARRNAIILAMANALYGAVTTALVNTGGLVGLQLAPQPYLATLPMSMMIIGTAVSTFPISVLMRRIGRRAGFVTFAGFGALGSLLGLAAIVYASFPAFLLACLMVGFYQASASYYRFAAADRASPAFRPKAISWVMTGGILAAVIGTMMVIGTRDLLSPYLFAGTWLVMAVIAALAIPGLTLVDIPITADDRGASGRPLAEIARQPKYIVACASAMMSYGIMVLVMTATPVAMAGCGFPDEYSSWVIQWHALAMFVPSFFTGHLIARFGAERIAATGMGLLILAAVAGLMGVEFENFAVGLVLLGLGWNFGYLGGTSLLTTTYQPAERNKAQGLNDFLVFGVTSVASLSAGVLLAVFDWNAVNYAVFPMVAVALAMIAWLVTHQRKAVA